MHSNKILQIIEKLYPFNYSVSGTGIYSSLPVYKSFLDFVVHDYNSGSILNKWEIPPGWDALSASVQFNAVTYDCLLTSSLGCSYLSPSFEGSVSFEELKKHSAYRQDLPGAIVYDWRRLYRKSERTNWGISLPYDILCQMEQASDVFDVKICTHHYDHYMPVLEFTLHGRSEKTVLINAHNCHPFQANDDISGCAIGIYLFQYLSTLSSLKYTYTLLIAPELYGPMFWLHSNAKQAENIIGTFLLKSLGNSAPLRLQEPFNDSTYISRLLRLCARKYKIPSESVYPFRSYYGNDETVFEAPGYRIPSLTLTRYPFLQYHTHLDDISILDSNSLEESFLFLQDLISMLESDTTAISIKPGLWCLSDPSLDLYLRAYSPGVDHIEFKNDDKKWNLLMNCLPMLLDDGLPISVIADTHDIDYFELYNYVKKWESKGLVVLS